LLSENSLEISRAAAGLRAGSTVTRGQVITYVGRMHRDSMLHFEMYSGFDSGPRLTAATTRTSAAWT
jgi:hypothetical protein